MPDATDTVVHHVGSLVAAGLNAHTAGLCRALIECQAFQGIPIRRFPCLCVWREREKTDQQGTPAKRTRNIMLRMDYVVGPVQVTKIVAQTALVSEVVGVIDDVIADQNHASYESGKGLYELAGVTSIDLREVVYLGGRESYPGAQLTFDCAHEYARTADNSAVLTEILGELNMLPEEGPPHAEPDVIFSGTKAFVRWDKARNPHATVGNYADTGLDISRTPALDSYVAVLVNGIQYELGDGVRTKDCYFSNDSGATARLIKDIVAGDSLFWNGLIAGFNLATTDEVDFDYPADAE